MEDKQFIKDIYGKLVGDRGYISKSLFRTLFVDGIHLLTRLKTNMKGSILSAGDSLLIRKRAIIESVNDELKNIAQVEHPRHRSLHNFLVNMMSAMSAYSLFPKKPLTRSLVGNCACSEFIELTLYNGYVSDINRRVLKSA